MELSDRRPKTMKNQKPSRTKVKRQRRFAGVTGSAPGCGKCGKRRCQYYGPVGGYSVQCKKCNEAQSEQRRAASKRRRKAQNEKLSD